MKWLTQDWLRASARTLVVEPSGLLVEDLRSRSGTRRTVRGVARVRVESIEGDVFHVVVLAASGGRIGEQLTYPRAALDATRGDEWRAFEELVAFLWGRR